MEQEQFVNETTPGLALRRDGRWGGRWLRERRTGTAWAKEKQPGGARRHRAGNMFPARTAILLTLAALPWPLAAQGGAADARMAAPSVLSGSLRPALAQVSRAVSSIDIRHWKAPGSVKSAAADDVTSIQRDLAGTLAGLLSQSEAAPGSVPSAFAVYRNVDALYDTLLRVVETADLAAPDEDASALEGALRQLEGARTDLGERILAGTQAQQNEVVRLKTILARAAAAPPPPVKTIVVDDGPVKKEEHHRHTTKKPAAKPADSSKPSPQ